MVECLLMVQWVVGSILPRQPIGEARCSSVVVSADGIVRWVIGSIPHHGPIELFLISASAP